MTDKSTALPAIDSLWDYNHPAVTAKKFRALIPQAKEQEDKSYYVELLTQLARTQSLQSNFDEAHVILDILPDLFTVEMVIPQIRYYLERGRTFNSSGEKEPAMEEFLKAFEIAKAAKQDYYLVDAMHMLGICEEPEEQIKWNVKAIGIAEQSKDERTNKWLGPLYNNTGWSYHDMGKYDEALELFEKSLAWRKEQQDAVGTFIAIWTIGRCYRSLNRIEESLQIQHELLKEVESGKTEPDGYVYEELGECLLLQDKKEEAKIYFKQAYELLSQDRWLQANEKERLGRLKSLGI